MAEDFDPTIPPPFSVAKLAEHWGCSGAMIRKLIDQGKLGHFRIGILIRIPRFAVEEFELLNTVGGMSAEAEPHTSAAEENAGPVTSPVVGGPRNIPRASRPRPPFKRPQP